MGWFFSFMFLGLVVLGRADEYITGIYLIAAGLFGIAGAIGLGFNDIKKWLEEADEEDLKK